MAQMRILGASPVVTAEDRAKALIQGTVGEFTVAELLEAWGRLNPLARPRIETADQVRDLARNGVFERRLRRDARARRVEEWPHVQRALAREREYIAVEHFVGREVYGKIANDSTSLRRYFHENVEFWRLPLRASVIRLDLPDRASANRMAVMLSNPAEADTLVARGLRQGARYKIEIAEELDSLLFARVVRARPDAVLGPDSTAQGWRVVKVGEILPSRLRRFEEVERLVRQRFYGVEGERLIVELLERLRRETPVTIHREALAKLRLD
jgi:hypothetical protein